LGCGWERPQNSAAPIDDFEELRVRVIKTSPMTSTTPLPSKRVEDEAEDSSSSGEEEDEEEEEPQLKYERIGGDIAKVVRGDLVSSFCVGSKLIVHPTRQH
jgi:hypothetical protein